VLDIALTGTVKRRQALLRSGARPGDDIYVSGTIGSAGAGLQMLQAASNGMSANERETNGPLGSVGSTRAAVAPAHSRVESCIERYLQPDPRVRLGLLLARNRAATSCVDLSDGLADGLHLIAMANGVGMIVDADRIPIDPSARAWFDARGVDVVAEAMTAGDDYELLFTAGKRGSGRLAAAARHSGVPLTRIGTCTAERSLVLRNKAGGTSPLPSASYRHFGS
jgi:thiamine-monophosphate kinase